MPSGKGEVIKMMFEYILIGWFVLMALQAVSEEEGDKTELSLRDKAILIIVWPLIVAGILFTIYYKLEKNEKNNNKVTKGKRG